ncbi:MAG: aldo/keto reductase [Chitinophagaceae bacterium]|nr:aldo/keto reductase [Chitinophagaceae bacterium]
MKKSAFRQFANGHCRVYCAETKDSILEKIYLSDAGPKVSQAVYSFWRWSNTPDLSESVMEKIVGLCLELGINSFDHADHYGRYECESVFGKVMANRTFKRDDIVLFTKCGLCIPEQGKNNYSIRHRNTSAKHITQTLEQSLRNLRTDYVDIFLLDGLDPISDLEETASALNKLKSAGKIKHVGIANFTVTQHQLLANTLQFPIVTNHVNLNVLNTLSLDNGQLDYSKQRYMHAIASEPLAGGRIEKGTDLQAKRVRAMLIELAEKYGTNVESLAVAWINKLGVIPLVGSLQESRIRNIAASFGIDLEHEDWYRIYEAGKVWPD